MKAFLKFLASGLPLILSSCAVLFTGVQKSTLIPDTKNVEISLISKHDQPEVRANVDSKGAGFVLDNYKSAYIIRQNKQGYKSLSTPVFPERLNALYFVDMGIPVLCDIMMPIAFTKWYLIGGTVGWFLPLLGPMRLYNDHYNLPALTPFPSRSISEKFLYLNRIGINAPKDSLSTIYYKSWKKYLSNDILYKSPYTESLRLKSLNFSDTLNSLLSQQGYSDSLKSILSNSFEVFQLECDITALTQNQVGELYNIELHSYWKLFDNFNQKEIIGKSIGVNSNFSFYDMGNEKLLVNHIMDALETSISYFLTDKEIKKSLTIHQQSFDLIFKHWNILDLKISHNNAASISEATKAVVTVKTRNGYGSGCILNSEGYIITCYHVTGDVDSTIEIITEAGMKLKASLIRYNPKYDLALLKAEGTFSDALNIDSSKTFELGTEIYAIGTPGEIELGQSLSKGIISGKRKISDRIYIQTDVSINKGNSGGALIDKNGSLIGIVNAKIVGLGVEGIGFAIPVTYIEEALKIKLR